MVVLAIAKGLFASYVIVLLVAFEERIDNPVIGPIEVNVVLDSASTILVLVFSPVGITLAGYYTATLPWVETWTYSIAAFTIIASIAYALVDYLRHRQQRPHTS